MNSATDHLADRPTAMWLRQAPLLLGLATCGFGLGWPAPARAIHRSFTPAVAWTQGVTDDSLYIRDTAATPELYLVMTPQLNGLLAVNELRLGGRLEGQFGLRSEYGTTWLAGFAGMLEWDATPRLGLTTRYQGTVGLEGLRTTGQSRTETGTVEEEGSGATPEPGRLIADQQRPHLLTVHDVGLGLSFRWSPRTEVRWTADGSYRRIWASEPQPPTPVPEGTTAGDQEGLAAAIDLALVRQLTRQWRGGLEYELAGFQEGSTDRTFYHGTSGFLDYQPGTRLEIRLAGGVRLSREGAAEPVGRASCQYRIGQGDLTWQLSRQVQLDTTLGSTTTALRSSVGARLQLTRALGLRLALGGSRVDQVATSQQGYFSYELEVLGTYRLSQHFELSARYQRYHQLADEPTATPERERPLQSNMLELTLGGRWE